MFTVLRAGEMPGEGVRLAGLSGPVCGLCSEATVPTEELAAGGRLHDLRHQHQHRAAVRTPSVWGREPKGVQILAVSPQFSQTAEATLSRPSATWEASSILAVFLISQVSEDVGLWFLPVTPASALDPVRRDGCSLCSVPPGPRLGPAWTLSVPQSASNTGPRGEQTFVLRIWAVD